MTKAARTARACKATTRAGAPCRAAPLKGGERCLAHSDAEARGKRRFGGTQRGAGRPRQPRPTEVLRERIEADIDAWLAPLEDARGAERTFVVGAGESAYIETVPDHAMRLRAVGEALDRAYGRPKQTAELAIDNRAETRREVEATQACMNDPEFRAAQRKILERVEAARAGQEIGTFNESSSADER